VNAEAIISFDKHFDNLKIPRKEPKDIVHLKM
jgi:predicted nucleic acid-binding protein